MTSDAGPAITRYDFTSGALRGTHFTLYATCLTHRGDNHLETLPLAAIASLRVAYERNARRIGWGVALLVVALILFAVSGPIAKSETRSLFRPFLLHGRHEWPHGRPTAS